LIAVDGADFGCRADGELVPAGLSWLARAGSRLRFEQAGPRPGRARAYLAVAGGLDVAPVLGSRATYLPAAMGGFAGRPLRAGDVLFALPAPAPAGALAGRYWPGDRPKVTTGNSTEIRFIPYDGPNSAGYKACEMLATPHPETSWTAADQSDRMGTRIRNAEDATVTTSRRIPHPNEVVSFGVVRGAIQLPPDGNPVILNADHQTTGGYPLVGVVAEVDWPLLAQLCPGDQVRFLPIDEEMARLERDRTAAAQERMLASLER
jgi:antagonist of KipI